MYKLLNLMMTTPATSTVKSNKLNASFTRALSGVVMAGLLFVAAGCTTAPSTNNVPAPKTAALSGNYQGIFLAPCSEMAEGLYYSDAMQLTPVDATHVEAAYFKAFFSASDCSGNSRLVRFALPTATWEILAQTLVGDKMVDQVIVTLPAGSMTAVINNADKVKETDEQFVISFGQKDSSIPLQKTTLGSVAKELRLIEGKQLFTSDDASPASPDGFPSALLDTLPFVRP